MNNDLLVIHDALQPYLPKTKWRYLFEGLAHLQSRILVKSIKKIKSMNKRGVNKMNRNIFALQQNLTNIIQFKETHFDRVRKFYSLVNLKEEVKQQQKKDFVF